MKKTQLYYICACGEKSSITWSNFRAGKRCWLCRSKRISQIQKLSYEQVSAAFSDANCQLISSTYINAHEKLDYICSCNHHAQISWNKFQQGERCPECANKTRANIFRHSMEKVKANLLQKGYTLKDEYINARTPLHLICKQDHETFSMTYDNIMKGQGCPKCLDRREIDLSLARSIFDEGGCKLLADTYVNNSTPMLYLCSCNRPAMISLANFDNGRRCLRCAIDKKSGPNSPWYNASLSEEERQEKRAFPGYYKWRKLVFKRDDVTCITCGHTSSHIEAHHLNSYQHFPEQRTELDNGATLCYWCHETFHLIYGRTTCTMENFHDFNNDIHIHEKLIAKLKSEIPLPIRGRTKPDKSSCNLAIPALHDAD